MTTPADAPPQYSPDGRWWWNGTAWEPASAVAPPAPPPYGAGFPPPPTGFGYPQPAPERTEWRALTSLICSILWLAGIGSIAAIVFGHLSRRASRQRNIAPSGVALAGLILGYLGLVFAAVAVAIPVFLNQRPTHQELLNDRADLQSTVIAMETYAVHHDGFYPGDLGELPSEGYSPPADGTTIALVSVNANVGYCLSARSPHGVSLYFDRAANVYTTTPCH